MHKRTPTTRHDPALVLGLRTTGLAHLACSCSFSTHLESEEGGNTFLNTTVELKTSRHVHGSLQLGLLAVCSHCTAMPCLTRWGFIQAPPAFLCGMCLCLWPFGPPHFKLRYSPSLMSNRNIPPERCSDLKSAHEQCEDAFATPLSYFTTSAKQSSNRGGGGSLI